MKPEKNWWLLLAIPLLFSGRFFVNHPHYLQVPILAILSVIIFSLPTVYAVIAWLGKKQGFTLLILLSLYAYAIEAFGVLTGFPYGQFSYGSGMGVKLFSLLPLTLPFAYLPLVFGAHTAANKTTYWKHLVYAVGLLVLIDMVLDPGAVLLNYWTYQNPGAYYGVPLQNFIGWIITGAGAMLIVNKYKTKSPTTKQKSYLLTGVILQLSFWTSITFAHKLYAPAGIGALLLVYFTRQLKPE